MAHKASTEAIIRLSVRVPEIPDHIFHVESQHDLAYNALIETRMKWVAAIAQYFATTKSMNQYHIRDWDIILNYDGKIENVGDQIVEAAYESAVRQYPARYQLPKELNSLAMSASEAVRRQEMFALGGMFYHILSGKQLFHELGDRAYISQVVSALLVEGKFPDDVWTLPMAEVILAHWCLEIGEEFKKFTMPKLEPPVFYTPFLGGMIFVRGVLAALVVPAIPAGIVEWGNKVLVPTTDNITESLDPQFGCRISGAVRGVFNGGSVNEDACVLKRRFLQKWKELTGQV